MEPHDKTGYSLANSKMSPCRNSPPPMGDAGLASPLWRTELGQLTSSLLCPERLDVLYVKSQNQICKGTHLARRTNGIPATCTKEARLTRLPPIPGNKLGMEGQCCSWGWTSKPGKPQEQLVKGLARKERSYSAAKQNRACSSCYHDWLFPPSVTQSQGKICKRLPPQDQRLLELSQELPGHFLLLNVSIMNEK